MSPNMLVVTITSKRSGARTTWAIMASTMKSSVVTSGNSWATRRHSSRNMPSPIFSTLCLCTKVTCLRRFMASSKAERAIRSQQWRVMRRSEMQTSGVIISSLAPDSMLRSA